jgi:tetratricopeptide (TPR) repeat protein
MDATMSLAARAVRAAREAGAVQQEAESSITLGSVRGYLNADDAGLENLRAGLTLATDIGAHFTALRAYVNISDVLELLGRHEEAVEAAREGIALVPGRLPDRQPGGEPAPPGPVERGGAAGHPGGERHAGGRLRRHRPAAARRAGCDDRTVP